MPRVVEWTTIVDGKSSCTLSKGKQLTFVNFMAMHDLHVEKYYSFTPPSVSMVTHARWPVSSRKQLQVLKTYWTQGAIEGRGGISQCLPSKCFFFTYRQYMHTISYIPLLFPAKSFVFYTFICHSDGLIWLLHSRPLQQAIWRSTRWSCRWEWVPWTYLWWCQGKSPPTNQPTKVMIHIHLEVLLMA